MTKHTPGPWKRLYQNHRCFSSTHIENDQGLRVCRMEYGKHHSADCNLIVAAPDLLAAAQALLRDSTSGPDNLFEVSPEVLDALEAAVDKARGGT